MKQGIGREDGGVGKEKGERKSRDARDGSALDGSLPGA